MQTRHRIIVGGLVLGLLVAAIVIASRSSDGDLGDPRRDASEAPARGVAAAPALPPTAPSPEVEATNVVREENAVDVDAAANAVFEVVDEDKSPMPDVEVRIYPRNNERLESFPEGYLHQKTDSHGVARFTVPKGQFAAISNPRCDSPATHGAGVEDFEIAGEEKVERELVMKDLASTLVVDVVDDAGDAIGDCEVDLRSHSGEKKRTDVQGHVEFSHLEAGFCSFEVRTAPDRNARHPVTTLQRTASCRVVTSRTNASSLLEEASSVSMWTRSSGSPTASSSRSTAPPMIGIRGTSPMSSGTPERSRPRWASRSCLRAGSTRSGREPIRTASSWRSSPRPPP